MSDLKARSKEAAENLDKLSKDLNDSFEAIQNTSLANKMSKEEQQAYRFFNRMVDTHTGTIAEVKEIFTLCVEAHQEYKDSMRFYRIFKSVFSGKGIAVWVLASLIIAAYKTWGGA